MEQSALSDSAANAYARAVERKHSIDDGGTTTSSGTIPQHPTSSSQKKPRARNRKKTNPEIPPADGGDAADDSAKRRCVSTACIACRKRKSKCDGNTPACAACSQVYGTECVYDPNSDHRRKGVYKKDIDSLKTRNSTLQTLIQALLNYPEEDVPALVRQIRTCESLDDVADGIVARENGFDEDEDDDFDTSPVESEVLYSKSTFETQLGTKMGELRLDDGSVRYIGGTSNLLFLSPEDAAGSTAKDVYQQQADPITSWTTVTSDPELVAHLLNMYFTWHYTYFTCLPKSLFYRDFLLGKPPADMRRKTEYCTPLLVNAILALGCHFTAFPGAREDADDSATAGDHFFKEAKRLIMENDEHEHPKITTVQALALMSVREAGCGREAKGWVYSGMSFRMACDMGLHLDSGALASGEVDEGEEDARRVTFWGCFLFDKCWSNYLGRLPQLPTSLVTVPKYDVFPDEDSAPWSPCTDSGYTSAHTQPARTRAVALQISSLCEISNDLMRFFYNPSDMGDAARSRGKQAELKKLSEIHTRLESWRRNLPKEMEPKEGGLSSVLIMHMFFQLLFIHLFRPFLKYNAATSPLPSTVSPRKLCTQAAAMISKLLRLYKRSHGLRQICNVCVYIAHSACTIHLLNLPDKNARRDIIHGVKHLEEIAEGWLCARRTLGILATLARKWNVELPDEAAAVLRRTDAKFGAYTSDATSPATAQDRRASLALIAQQAPSLSQPTMWPPLNQHHQQQQQQHQQQHQQTQSQSQQSQMLRNSSISGPTNYFSSAHYIPTSASTGGGGAASGPKHHSTSAAYALPPPTSAHDLLPNGYPSANTTPLSGRGHHGGSLDGTGGVGHSSTSMSGASPSDMFGGVEQLLRDSQDWVFRDQSQLASGFGNWGLLDGEMSGSAGGAGAGAGAGSAGNVVGAAEAGWADASSALQRSPVTAKIGAVGAYLGAGDGVGGAGAFAAGNAGYASTGPGLAALDGNVVNGYAHLTRYNEDEWYQ